MAGGIVRDAGGSMGELKKTAQWLDLISIGFMFPLSIGVGYLLGRGLDRLMHSYPWCTIIFTVFGIAAAFINLFRMAARADVVDRSEPPDAP